MERLTRRRALAVLGLSAVEPLLPGCDRGKPKAEQWPTDEAGILKTIEGKTFPPGSRLTTTILPRKIMYESAKLAQANGEKWTGGESDWMVHLDVFEESVQTLAENGVKGGRLAVFPFELTEDRKVYNWKPVDTALAIMTKHEIKPDLCLGPFDYPYGPGVRLPKDLQTRLKNELVEKGKKEITISMKDDPNAPELSQALREYGLHFLDLQLQRYGKDPRIGKFYIGNEYPDTHGVEGVDVRMSFAPDFMEEVIRRTLIGTDKQIAMNTNIYPNDGKMERSFGNIFRQLGERGVLGVDTYPTRESQNPQRYGADIQTLRKGFPKATLEFTEAQYEPYVESPFAGKPWVDLLTDKIYGDEIKSFFTKDFPSTIDNHLIASGIPGVGLWEPSLWLVAHKMGYTFPMRMLSTMASAMAKN